MNVSLAGCSRPQLPGRLLLTPPLVSDDGAAVWGSGCRSRVPTLIGGFLTALAVLGAARPAQAQVLEKLGVGKDTPVFLTSFPGNVNLLLIVERGSAKITKMLVEEPIGPGGGTPMGMVFLDLSGKAKIPISTDSDFSGVTGIAFHPDFTAVPPKRYFYVRYNALDESVGGAGDKWRMIIERYDVPIGTGNADLNSALELYSQLVDTTAPPSITHNSGQIHFDTLPGSRRLYCAMPDDARGPNMPPTCLPEMYRAQDPTSDLGKLLVFPDIDNLNPLPMLPTHLARGLRNPFGFSVDLLNGDVWMGNTGPDCSGDVFIWPAGTGLELNYGWPCMIGDCVFPTNGLVAWDCDPTDPLCQSNMYTQPEYIVANTLTGGGHDALIGGYVYRGSEFPAWQGKYIFGLFLNSWIFLYDPNLKTVTNITASLGIGTGQGSFRFWGSSLHGFGQDEDGELYVIRVNTADPLNPLDNGTIFKIVNP